MTDRMDQIVEAAERQGFEVRQTAEGTWIFCKGLSTIVQPPPLTAGEWLNFIVALRQLGLVFPPE